MSGEIVTRIADGRTDLVFQYPSEWHAAHSTDHSGTPLITWCAYYGDVSADMNGDSPLTWASWHLRPASVLRKLCYGDFAIHRANNSTYDHGMGW
jgi:hypothetical protein